MIPPNILPTVEVEYAGSVMKVNASEVATFVANGWNLKGEKNIAAQPESPAVPLQLGDSTTDPTPTTDPTKGTQEKFNRKRFVR